MEALKFPFLRVLKHFFALLSSGFISSADFPNAHLLLQCFVSPGIHFPTFTMLSFLDWEDSKSLSMLRVLRAIASTALDKASS